MDRFLQLLPAGLVSILLIVLLLVSTGCAGGIKLPDLQKLLDNHLAPDFRGDAKISHWNNYVNFTIEFSDLHRTESGWRWSGLVYNRAGIVSKGEITITKK